MHTLGNPKLHTKTKYTDIVEVYPSAIFHGQQRTSQTRSAGAAEGGEKERVTAWNIISAKFKLRPSPCLECISTVWAVCYTH